jgi:1,4-dihydroxy-6-naphthoate synthase
VVAKQAASLDALRGKRNGVPGLRTTAYLVLRLALPDFEPVIVPVAPISAAFDALEQGNVDALVLIHEGRLLYEQRGLACIADLGVAFANLTGGLPLPLGGNVIARALGAETIARVSHVLRTSIRYALEHREEVLSDLVSRESRPGVPRDHALFDRYLAMYANQDTLDYGEQGVRAIRELLERGHRAGIIPHAPQVELAP